MIFTYYKDIYIYIYIYMYVTISYHFEIFIVKDCKIISIKLIQRFFQFKLLQKKKYIYIYIFLIQFCINASIITINYKIIDIYLLQWYIYVAISCHFEIFIVKDCKINSIKLLQRFFQFKLLPKKNIPNTILY